MRHLYRVIASLRAKLIPTRDVLAVECISGWAKGLVVGRAYMQFVDTDELAKGWEVVNGVYQRVALERLDGADGSRERRLTPEIAEIERGVYHGLLEEGAMRENRTA